MIAWAWGVSALIDTLEDSSDANIDTTKLGVTGCSRNGKGALGAPDAMGYSQVGHGDHCTLPQSQFSYVNAYVRKFLLNDNSAETRILQTDGNFSFEEETWIDWTSPVL